MVRVENLGKRFGSSDVLQEVNFTVLPGEVVTLLGPNGAGKSTLMRILTGVLMPSTGAVWIGEHRMDEAPLEAKKLLGYLPEQTPCYPELTVEEYLSFAAEAKGVSRDKKVSKLNEVIGKCDLIDFRRKRMGILSKGTLRRVGIAQAIVNNPRVLILDEPTAGLDPAQAISFRQLILRFKEQTSIILSTHLMTDASQLSDRVLFIQKGRILLEDSVEGLKKRFYEKNIFQIKFKVKDGAALPAPELFRTIEGVNEVILTPQSEAILWDLTVQSIPGWNPTLYLLPFLTSRNWELVELFQKTLDLEEVFNELTRGRVE